MPSAPEVLGRESRFCSSEIAFVPAPVAFVRQRFSYGCSREEHHGMSRKTRDPAAAARAKDFLERSVGVPVSLEDVARAAGVSRGYMVRLFRKTYGITPFEYRRRLRLRRAQELLRAGLRGVDVAYEVGFSDQSHMCQALRAVRPVGGRDHGSQP